LTTIVGHREVVDRDAHALGLRVLQGDLKSRDHMAGRALQGPVIAKAAQILNPELDLEAFPTHNLWAAQIHDRLKDEGCEDREIALPQPGHAIVQRNLDHPDGALGTVREALLDLGVVGIRIGGRQENTAYLGD
jgi:hypothetical protein